MKPLPSQNALLFFFPLITMLRSSRCYRPKCIYSFIKHCFNMNSKLHSLLGCGTQREKQKETQRMSQR